MSKKTRKHYKHILDRLRILERSRNMTMLQLKMLQAECKHKNNKHEKMGSSFIVTCSDCGLLRDD